MIIPECGEEFIEWFWDLRSFAGGSDHPLTPAIVADWALYKGALLCREEQSIIYEMDRAFRSGMPKTIEYHQKRRDKQQGA